VSALIEATARSANRRVRERQQASLRGGGECFDARDRGPVQQREGSFPGARRETRVCFAAAPTAAAPARANAAVALVAPIVHYDVPASHPVGGVAFGGRVG
jgi:hypothetical protein